MKKISLIVLLMLLLVCWKGKISLVKVDRDIDRIVKDIKITDEDKYIYLWSTGLTLSESGEIEAAEKYYLAAAKYNKEAYGSIGNMYYFRVDKEKGIKKFEEGYAKGDGESAFQLGGVYYQKGDIQKAKEWYLKGAELGNVKAQHNLGVTYRQEKNR